MSGYSNTKLTIIIVSYNTRDLTIACLDSLADELASLPENSVEVIVVDNASKDGSATAIVAHEAPSQVIPLADNIGFAAANNLAAQYASGEYLLLLNPDTVVLPGAIIKVLKTARRNPRNGIWGGRTLFGDKSLNPSSCWSEITLWNLFCRAVGLTAVFKNTETFNGEAYGGWTRDNVRNVDIVSGCFLLITRSLWRQLNGFDLSFWMYGEDADLCLRAKRLGYQPMIDPSAEIIHYGGASEKTRTGKMIRLLDAKAKLIRHHWHPRLVPLGLALLAAWPASRLLALATLASVSKAVDVKTSAQAWREIWATRLLWWHGASTGRTTSFVPSPH